MSSLFIDEDSDQKWAHRIADKKIKKKRERKTPSARLKGKNSLQSFQRDVSP